MNMNNSDPLEQYTVLVLNKYWQAIHVKTPLEAISMMFANTATALYVENQDVMQPLSWSQWLELPFVQNERYVHTVSLKIRIPKIIILSKFNKVPQKRPKLNKKNIWVRDNFTCQYTGKKLKKDEGNIDHVIPKSKGGRTDWNNLVLASKEVNQRKADNIPEKVGLELLKKPSVPPLANTTDLIVNSHNIAEWDIFLKKRANAG